MQCHMLTLTLNNVIGSTNNLMKLHVHIDLTDKHSSYVCVEIVSKNEL